ncbi:MAG: SpoIIE family protein phosphatase [Euryarchaeota archaeon]|nr:SpoIIE family protein phosphatase [Euryarchaeota archaeon]
MVSKTLFDYSISYSPIHGETVSGDACLVRCNRGFGLIAVIDALGHGIEAASVAKQAIDALKKGPMLPFDQHLVNAHAALRQTRGAVMNVALLDGKADHMTWSGVGDVEGVLIRAKNSDEKDRAEDGTVHKNEHIPVRPGIVGLTLPKMFASGVDLEVGDVLIMTTDGIKNDYVRDVDVFDDLSHIAERIMSDHSKGHDDSLVLVLRWKGISDREGKGSMVERSRRDL